MEAAYAAWAARDLNTTLAAFADDVVFVIHLPPEVAPFVGEARGKAELRGRLQVIIDEFDFLEYRPLNITAEGEHLHSRIGFRYRHKATGLEYDGTMRHVWRVEGDRIVRFEEFHDAERVRTFFAMVAQAQREARQ
jgi:ketosteroid isomerase-like protein